MTRGVFTRLVLLAVFVAMVLPFSQAVFTYSCPENQTILRLSNLTNAHAEKYNGGNNYPIQICYNEIFEVNYNGANPHQCGAINLIPNNTVLRLSSDTNAHAGGL